MKYISYYTCPRENNSWEHLSASPGPYRCPGCDDEVEPYQTDEAPDAPLAGDRVAMHTFTQRAKRTAFKHACERSGLTMEAKINSMMSHFVTEEEETRRATPADTGAAPVDAEATPVIPPAPTGKR